MQLFAQKQDKKRINCLLLAFFGLFFGFLAFFCTASVSVSVFGYFLIYLFRFSCVVVFVGLQPATAPTALLDFFLRFASLFLCLFQGYSAPFLVFCIRILRV